MTSGKSNNVRLKRNEVSFFFKHWYWIASIHEGAMQLEVEVNEFHLQVGTVQHNEQCMLMK